MPPGWAIASQLWRRRADSHFGLAKLLMRLLEIDIKDLSEAEAAVQLLGAVLPKARFVRRSQRQDRGPAVQIVCDDH